MAITLLQSLLRGENVLVPFAHPIHGLKPGLLGAREILTRFRAGNGEMVAVGDLLQDMHLPRELQVELDMLCLESTFRALGKLPASQALNFVNLEPLTLSSEAFWGRVPVWLEASTFPASQIVLEFTEGHVIHDMEVLQGHARKLREFGLRIAVDDLGSGVASLTHMARLAPDFIKADRSLVEQVHRRPYQAALLNALSVFANRMCVGFIAEGVETEDELQAIIDADVPWAQGFLFGMPAPLLPEDREDED